MTELIQKANEANMTISDLLKKTDNSSVTELDDFIDVFFQAIAANFQNKMHKLRVKFIPVGFYSRENNMNLVGFSFLNITNKLNVNAVDRTNLTAPPFLSISVTVVLGTTVVKFPAGQPM
jgi:hypothetical protein